MNKPAPGALRRFVSKCQVALIIVTSLGASSLFAHEDHASRHGGFVMMFLEMHFEIVVPDEGGVQIYYSDPLRTPLPAAVVSDVAVEIERPGNTIESVFMTISDSGEAWEGESSPVENPETIVRVAFLFQGEPFVLDIPASVFPEDNGDGGETPEDSMQMPMEGADEDMQHMNHGAMNHGCERDCAG